MHKQTPLERHAAAENPPTLHGRDPNHTRTAEGAPGPPITDRSEVEHMLHRDLLQLLGSRQGSVTAHTRLVAAHLELVSEYVRLLQPTTTSPVMIGRIDVEPGPHSDFPELKETPVDRWMTKPGPLRPVRARALWLLWPAIVFLGWANERGSHRFVVAFGPLVRIFLGTHIRRTALRIAQGYALLALTIDPCVADSPARAAWLASARHDLGLLASYMPTWRSLANALLGIPLISLLPTIMFTALGTDSLQTTIETYGQSLLTSWGLWLPTALYFLTAVSWVIRDEEAPSTRETHDL